MPRLKLPQLIYDADPTVIGITGYHCKQAMAPPVTKWQYARNTIGPFSCWFIWGEIEK